MGGVAWVAHGGDPPAEAHSQLRRIEQQIRWATAKADALRSGGSELGQAIGPEADVSRLLVLRVTRANLEVVSRFGRLLAVSYPARHADAIGSLTGDRPWPGPALIWADVVDGVGRLRAYRREASPSVADPVARPKDDIVVGADHYTP